MTNNKVLILRTEDSQAAIDESVGQIIGSYDMPDDVNNVSIKPNLCYYWKPSTGYTTDPRIVSSIIDNLRHIYGTDLNISIVEADATGMRVKHAFTMLDYGKLAESKKVKLINLSEDKCEKINLNINGADVKFSVPKTITETDLFINVPKMKIMRETHITGAMKTLFGCISETKKIRYHKILSETIVAVNKVVKPDINIMDGIYALSEYPVKLNTLMASDDAYFMDCVAAKIMGYDPDKIKFLKLARKEGLGEPRNLEVIGDLESIRVAFPKVNNMIYRNSFKVLLFLLKIYSNIVNDVVPPMLEGL